MQRKLTLILLFTAGFLTITLNQTFSQANNKETMFQDEYFADRPDSPSASVASAAPNIPVKKEKFADKINRIKSDNNKIGLVFYSEKIYVNPNTMDETFKSYRKVDGYLPAYSDMEELAEEMVTKLNKSFNTDIIELVDPSTIPYTNGKFMGMPMKMDDWWSTKYKIVFIYKLIPYYDAFDEREPGANESQFKTGFKVITKLEAKEFMNGKKKNEQKYVLKPIIMESYSSDVITPDQKTVVTTIADLKTLVEQPESTVVKTALLDNRKASYPKVIKKLSK
jgi:hypothetical protein